MKQIDPFVGVAVGALGASASLGTVFFGANDWIALAGFTIGIAIFSVNGRRWINGA